MNILLAYDTSTHSQAAAQWAARLASGEPGSTITVVAVVQTLEMSPVSRQSIDPTVHPETLDQAITEAAAELTKQAPGAKVEARLLSGNPAEQILDAANGADIIVMGKAGSHGVARFLIGTVVERVARHSKTAVLIAQ